MKDYEIKVLKEGYIGTYASEDSRGVYHFRWNEQTGEMTEPELFYEAPNAKWVSFYGDMMAFPIEKEERAGTCFLEIKNGIITQEHVILEEKQTPCYILQEGDFIYTANYHEGTVIVYRVEGGKPAIIKRIENGEKAGCHQILLHGPDLLVPCLIQNKIRFFDRDHGYEPSGELEFPEGTGPRHGIFNREHTRFYVVSEWSNELFVYEVLGREFQLQETVSVLPEEDQGQTRDAASAAIRLTKDEKFLYISVREMDLLTVLDVSGEHVKAVQHVSCRGVHPRDMILSGNENYVLAVNRFEGGIVSIQRDEKSGRLGEIKHQVNMPQGVSILLK